MRKTLLREAFQTKKRRNLGTVQIGGIIKKSKKSQFSVGKSSKLGEGVFGNQKSPKFQRVPKTAKIITNFNLIRNKKYKILSIVVLKMAKYNIISLILTDFVQYFFSLESFPKSL